MSKSMRNRASLATITTTLIVAALAAAPAAATKTVTIQSGLQISAYGYKGKVTSANSACVEDRTVVLKQKGYGKLGSAKSSETGKWEVSPEDLHFKGPLPYKLYAEAKPLSQGTAGTIYKCLGATSKTIEIAGG